MPERITVFKWLSENEVFNTHYARAREDFSSVIAEELLEIVDDESGDTMEVEGKNGKVRTMPNHAKVQRDRLRADTRKWLLSKLAPKKYGESIAPAAKEDFALTAAQSISKALREIDATVPGGRPNKPDKL
jgi:hypothetical protein